MDSRKAISLSWISYFLNTGITVIIIITIIIVAIFGLFYFLRIINFVSFFLCCLPAVAFRGVIFNSKFKILMKGIIFAHDR